MAITAARRASRPARGAFAALLLLAGCVRPDGGGGGAPGGPQANRGPEPEIRVGLVTGSPSVTIGSTGGIDVTQPDGTPVGRVPALADWRATPAPGSVTLRPAGTDIALAGEQLILRSADTAGALRINNRPYRGEIVLLRDRTGLTVVNRLPLETYLLSVVSSEMGRREAADLEALRAQAIVSRTYALRNLGRWREQGFDLYAGVADQVYGGVTNENPLGNEAVAATRGRVLTYAGALVDAFFFSTCGGRTAEGTEVFRGAERPYLRSVDDTDPGGRAYCSISPRFRWREEWTGDELRSTLRRTLPAVVGVPAADLAEVRDVRVAGRSPSGRVSRLTLVLGRAPVTVEGAQIRQVLRPANAELLRSALFSLAVSGAGRRVSRLVADGSGAGHGVGMCQWGAVGRARAGQTYPGILAAYYPGTDITTYY